jgi:hypothetical protein
MKTNQILTVALIGVAAFAGWQYLNRPTGKLVDEKPKPNGKTKTRTDINTQGVSKQQEPRTGGPAIASGNAASGVSTRMPDTRPESAFNNMEDRMMCACGCEH